MTCQIKTPKYQLCVCVCVCVCVREASFHVHCSQLYDIILDAQFFICHYFMLGTQVFTNVMVQLFSWKSSFQRVIIKSATGPITDHLSISRGTQHFSSRMKLSKCYISAIECVCFLWANHS